MALLILYALQVEEASKLLRVLVGNDEQLKRATLELLRVAAIVALNNIQVVVENNDGPTIIYKSSNKYDDMSICVQCTHMAPI